LIDIGWLILIIYALGHLLTWITAFRMMLQDDLLGLDPDDGPGMALGTIIIMGFLSFILALFWPFVVVIFLVFKYAVKPYLKKES